MNDHNTYNLALQNRIAELEAVLIQRDDQLRELQHLHSTINGLRDLCYEAADLVEDLIDHKTRDNAKSILARLNAEGSALQVTPAKL